MKQVIMMLLLTVTILSIGCGKPAPARIIPPGTTNASSVTDWKNWLVRYEAFIDEYIALRKRLEAGDQSAALQASDFAARGQALNKEAGQLGFALPEQDRADFNSAYQTIRKKLEDAGLDN